jgi:hypothetical protein
LSVERRSGFESTVSGCIFQIVSAGIGQHLVTNVTLMKSSSQSAAQRIGFGV